MGSQLLLTIISIAAAFASIIGAVYSAIRLKRKRDAEKSFEEIASNIFSAKDAKLDTKNLYSSMINELSSSIVDLDKLNEAKSEIRNYLVHLDNPYQQEISSGLDQPSTDGQADYVSKLLNEIISKSSFSSSFTQPEKSKKNKTKLDN